MSQWHDLAFLLPPIIQLGRRSSRVFPDRLSETGLFADTVALVPTSDLLPYEVQIPLWSDDAIKRRWMRLPDGKRIGFDPDTIWDTRIGTILVKHFDIPTGPGGLRRLEIRLLVHRPTGYAGVTYRWGADQADARRLEAGEEEILWVEPARVGCSD
jgi:hypothetical protein